MECIVNKPRLAFIGAGDIAGFHAQAAKKAGFILEAVAAKPDSTRVKIFGKQHGFNQIFDSPSALLGDQKWDALLICSSHETLHHYTNLVVATERPVLVEKPVGLTSAALRGLLEKETENIRVAYNRRFYLPVQRAKDFLAEEGPCVVSADIPESVNLEDRDPSSRYKNVFTNSVHMLDLLGYLLGPIEIDKTFSVANAGKVRGRFMVGKSTRGDLVKISANWNSPSNFSISIDSNGLRFQLLPLEKGAIYEGMRIEEPSATSPVRKYVPNLVREHIRDEKFAAFKPGFVEQMLAFAEFCEGGKTGSSLASLSDAYEALRLAEILIDPKV